MPTTNYYYSKLIEEMDVLYDWGCKALGSKSNCMKFPGGFNGTEIDFVQKIKFLGTIQNPQLTFGPHCILFSYSQFFVNMD